MVLTSHCQYRPRQYPPSGSKTFVQGSHLRRPNLGLSPHSSDPHLRRKATDRRSGECACDISVASRVREAPVRHYKNDFVNIVLQASGSPDVKIRSVSWATIVDYCGAKHLSQYLDTYSDGIPFLALHAALCEPMGIVTVLHWILSAYGSKSRNILPCDLLDNADWPLVDLCYIERALAVLGLHQERDEVCLVLHSRIDKVELPVSQIKNVLESLPEGGYWPSLILVHIRRRLQTMLESNPDDKECACGWKIHMAISAHVECLYKWVYGDERLLEAIERSDESQHPSLLLPWGAICPESTRRRIEDWTMQVEDKRPYPLGVAPSARVLVGSLKARIATHRQLGSITGTYKMEWSDAKGGHFIETYPNGRRPQRRGLSTKTTDVSREWLASRGYRGGGAASTKGRILDEEDSIRLGPEFLDIKALHIDSALGSAGYVDKIDRPPRKRETRYRVG